MALILWSTEEITWEEQELVQRSSFSLEKNWKASSFLHGLEMKRQLLLGHSVP